MQGAPLKEVAKREEKFAEEGEVRVAAGGGVLGVYGLNGMEVKEK